MARLINDIRVRLYLAGQWRDVSSDVRYEQAIATRGGYGAEDELAPPATCRLTLDNRSGNYTEHNPLGPYYPSLGRSTPFELAIRTVKDTATTNAASSWGSTDAHPQGAWDVLAWTNAGGVASDFNKASGKATHLISTANDSRYSWLAGYSQRIADFAVTLSLPFTNVTGGVVGLDLFMRGTGAITAYYAARILIQTDESVQIDLVDINGTSLTLFGPETVSGLTHSSSQALRLRMQTEGRTVRAKVWPVGTTEPFDWPIIHTDQGIDATTDELMDAPGFVGVRSIVGAGNTNVPVTFSYDDFEILTPEFAGEVAAWPRNRDTTGNERTISITAADVTRRLNESPTDSALRRFILNSPYNGYPPWVYWPLEEGEAADPGTIQPAAGSGTVGFVLPSSGSTVPKLEWAADKSLPGGLQGPSLTGGGSLIFWLSPVTEAASWSASWGWKQSYSDGGFCMLTTESSHIQLAFSRAASSLTLNINQSVDGAAASTVMSYDFADKNDVEEWHLISLEAFQTGADYAYFLHVDGVQVDSHTQSPGTLDGLRRVQLFSVVDAAQNTYFQHLAVYSSPAALLSLPPPSMFSSPFFGYAGERALPRAERLCDEENITFGWIGSGVGGTADNTEPMGAQRPDNFLSLVQACAKVDNGMLYTQRSSGGLQFRTLETMYSREPWLELSLSAGHFSPPWSGTADDQALVNDITVTREQGGQFRHRLDDGSRMSVTSPAEGGAGPKTGTASVNTETDTQLVGQAQWRVHLGTADEDRFSGIKLELAREVFRDTAGLALSARLRDLDVGDLIALTGLTSEFLYDDLIQVVFGISKRIDQFTYDMTLVCRPGSRYRVFTLDSSYLDDEDTTLNEALDTTETGVDVAIAATGRIWSAADQPYDLATGGERMTLTALSGAGSPQTFTVTRSVNGVVKEHPTGQPISLAEPDYLGK
jgi:hypothetical protein